MKKIIKWLGIILLALFLFLLAAPFLFKDKIVSKIKEEANKNLNAKINFGDFSLSLIKSFPDFSLGIENLSIINIDPFEGDTLIYSEKIDVTVDIMSVIRGGEINIKTVELNGPVMNFLVNKEEAANWDIAKGTDEAGEASGETSFKGKLKHYSVKNGRVLYKDESLDFLLSLNGVDHEGKGDFTQDVFDLVTNTEVQKTQLVYESIPYISGAKAVIDATLNIDMKNFKFTFKENKINLNALDLGVDGWVAMPDTNIDMQLDFTAAKSEFRNFISMIPALYAKDFESLKSSGTMSLAGFIKGRYNAVSMPGFGLTLKIDNGMFQYPSLPSSVSKVFVDLNVKNPDGIPDHTIIDLKKLSLEMAGAPFEAALFLRTPVSDPDINMYAKGKIDLGSVREFVPLEQGTKLTGMISADLKAKGRMSVIERKQYELFEASGNLNVRGLEYSATDVKNPVSVSQLDMTFSPRLVSLNTLVAKSGKSDFNASGSLENFIPYALKDQTLQGKLKLRSEKIDLNEWMSSEESPGTADTSAMTVFEVPANIDFTVDAAIGTLVFDNLNIFNLNGNLIVRDEALRLQGLAMQLMDGSVDVNGSYSSRDKKHPAISMDLAIRNFDIVKTVNSFESVEKLAPLAKYCAGKFSAALKVEGKLDEAMSPELSSLNGLGKLSTSQITITNFPAFNKVADVLKMQSWKQADLAPVNPSFKIVNGRVYVDPTEIRFKDMKGTVAGSNGFDQTIDYTMAMEIPRSAFGGAANAVLNNLVSSANAKGANFSLGDVVPVNLKIGGTVDKPSVSTDLGKQGANVMDDLKAKAQEEFDKKKAELESKAREEAEKLKADAAAKLEAEKAKAAAEVDRLKKEAEAKAKATADSLKKAAEEEAKKKAKDALKNLNPLKK